MGLSASQGRMLLLTARKSDLEYRAQQISQKRLVLSQQLEEIATEYENATSNRQMKIALFLNGDPNVSGSEAVSRTTNLTYAALISGTLNHNSSLTGIQSYGRTEDQQYSSTSAYRLVDADGAIVVSSVEEIQNVITQTVTRSGSKQKLNDTTFPIYTDASTHIDANGNKSISSGKTYAVPPKKADNTDSEALTALKAALGTGANAKTMLDCEVDTEQGIIKFKNANSEYVYYNLSDGTALTDEAKKTNFKGIAAQAVADVAQVPEAKVTEDIATPLDVYNSESESTGANLVLGSDGKYTLKDKNGAVINRYVVDPTLAYGSTDVNGSTDGPNYLQDCLRNGKYLLEKGGEDQNGDFKWQSLSWDATANISDSYYTEDDDAAKAKYDRLQTQIQAQDKKLELELDNIETQRSAVTTEEESVKKVIDENIEGSFNAFA